MSQSVLLLLGGARAKAYIKNGGNNKSNGQETTVLADDLVRTSVSSSVFFTLQKPDHHSIDHGRHQ